ncbi:hypothetical protein [Mesobacillus stamsii]|uniref:Phage protein n=1 Tax=Mesobacillus stamsii TaxID=225347 RepID=A0ABU0FWD7_9BACI|nr:hypothetical protein [Mesobacillus stamsii]MDQ0414245.1 hypothetical protein [Mesobacillus stamsii]
MRISRSSQPHEAIGYYVLPDGKVDVFLRKNETTEIVTDDNGKESAIYVAEEVYLQVDTTVTKTDVETDFNKFWDMVENPVVEPTIEERLAMTEDTINFILGL